MFHQVVVAFVAGLFAGGFTVYRYQAVALKELAQLKASALAEEASIKKAL
jgi:hypothetical protein